LTNRAIPGGLQWQASYNSAGQILQEQLAHGGNTTRTTTYNYYSAGPFAGLADQKTDGRGTISTYLYDDWLRATNKASTGSLAEQNLTTTWIYDPRGNLIGMTEQFASPGTGPSTSIQRSYDSYGQMSGESVSDGSFGSNASQSWDVTGRRSGLNIGNGGYGFCYQADGTMISAEVAGGGGAYSYSTAGILTNRAVGLRNTGVTSLDGEGRPLTVASTIDGESLTETLSYSGDGLLQSDTLIRPDFRDSRSYSYANLSRRLTYEQLNLNGSTTWTNNFTYDNGTPAGPGALTQMGQANGSSGLWNGGVDAFSRINAETNNTFSYSAYGHVNGQSTLSAWLDNNPISITGVGTNAMQWEAAMELSPGSHQLTVAALHPSGRFTAWATNYFTNSLAYQQTVDSYDANGDITNRVWENPSGTVERTQSLSWDARGRLHAVNQHDASNSGYNWTAVYDPLNRRISTTTVLVTNGVVYPSSVETINSYYDPLVEFLELGVSYGIHTEWKLYGPDLNGQYGGVNGVGGLDGISPGLSLFNPTISDVRGNILGYYDSAVGSVTWNAARPTGFGAVPNYRPVALASGGNLEQSSVWRGHWVDITGYYNIGLRPYDPVSGSWLTFDSAWNERDPNYYTFCGGDPVNAFDSDGRMASGFYTDVTGGKIPVDASSSFMAGFDGANMLGAAPEGVQQGSAIVANTATLGQINSLNTYANSLQGSIYDWSRAFADVGVGSAALASGGWALEASPTLYVAAVNASVNPWTYVAAGGAASAAYTYSEGGSPQDVAYSAVSGGVLTYAAAPFPVTGPTTIEEEPTPVPTSTPVSVTSTSDTSSETTTPAPITPTPAPATFAPTTPEPTPGLDPVQVLQNLTDQQSAALNANPALAQTVLSFDEVQAVQTRPYLNPVAYGNAVQRLVNQQIANNPSYQTILEPIGGANQPDYIGVGSAAGMNFDITTPGQVDAHLARPGYGQGLNIITYQRAPGWTLPPLPATQH
jgi:RHS repeat-associated protein